VYGFLRFVSLRFVYPLKAIKKLGKNTYCIWNRFFWCSPPGGSDYDVKSYYTVSLNYSRQLSKRWDLFSGVEYTKSTMTVTPAFTGEERQPLDKSLTLATIPVQLKFHFGKRFF
jgi:hypothetical protein